VIFVEKMRKTMEATRDSGLCTGCGTCVGLCPNSAIYMSKCNGIYVPILNQKKCNRCGICFEVCPGHSVNLEKLSLIISGKKQQESLIGNYANCYIGHSTSLKIRYNSSSGGLVTALLVFALKKRIIDGTLVTRMSDTSPLDPEVFIAKTENEIISASRSKYCPVPANIALKHVLRSNGKFATVGLPCHIEGIRKAEIINRELAKKIVLHLGLICNHAPTFLATTYLLKKMNVRKEEVKKIDYRGKGWPGQMSITLKDGEKKSIQHFDPYYWGHVFNSYFLTSRCILCNDKVCELSDISFGDAWNLSNSKIGESLIVSRNNIGEELLWKAAETGIIKMERINSAQVIGSQGLDLIKRRHNARTRVFRKLGREVPTYNQKEPESKPLDYVTAILAYLRMYISSKPHLWGLLDIYPFLMRMRARTLQNACMHEVYL
jgi:coenzyme F420 hydrogenase subunit beta